MKVSELYKLGRLIGTVVSINQEHADVHELNMDGGMLGRVTKITHEHDYIVVTLNVREFEEYNKTKAQPNFFDKDGRPTLKWHETTFYPKDGREDVYIEESLLDECFDVASELQRGEAARLQSRGAVDKDEVDKDEETRVVVTVMVGGHTIVSKPISLTDYEFEDLMGGDGREKLLANGFEVAPSDDKSRIGHVFFGKELIKSAIVMIEMIKKTNI